MDWKNLAAAVLTPLVAFALKAFFALIGYEVDPAVLNALVVAIVTWLLSLFLADAGARGVRAFRARG